MPSSSSSAHGVPASSSNNARSSTQMQGHLNRSIRNTTNSGSAQTSQAAFQQNNAVQSQAWPGVLSAGLPFIMPPMPPHLANNHTLTPASPFPMPFAVPSLPQVPGVTSPSKQNDFHSQSQLPANYGATEADKEEGELSDRALPTGPASMNRKKILQASREHSQQGARISKKQAKREAQRAAALNKAGRGE